MPSDPKKLRAYLGRHDDGAAEMPRAWGVLYAPPNPDGSRKRCGNCVMYATADRRCYVHAPDLDAAPEAVCGYHVFSPAPMATFGDRVPMEPVAPELSGLGPGDTSCDRCRYFTPRGRDYGTCRAVADDAGVDARVDALGCCARWEPGDDG